MLLRFAYCCSQNCSVGSWYLLQKPKGFRCYAGMCCSAKQPSNKVNKNCLHLTSSACGNIQTQLYVLLLWRTYRYYKNSIAQQPGWNKDIIGWCRKEAERLKLKPEDYWGAFVFDEMKIQVKCYLLLIVLLISLTSYPNYVLFPHPIFILNLTCIFFVGRSSDESERWQTSASWNGRAGTIL
jgi:hypothetical protein